MNFKFIWKHKGTRAWFITTCVLLVLVLVVSLVITQVPIINNSLGLVFGGERAKITDDRRDELYDREYKSKKEVLSAAEDFVVSVAEEGVTLLKNEGGALPLGASPKVSVFGKNSVNLVYGGSGSASGASGSTRVTLYYSLTAAGIAYNPALKSFYDDNTRSGGGRPDNPAMTSGQRLSGFATGETAKSGYDGLTSSYADYRDAAIVVFSRIGGEGFDLPRTMATDFGSDTAVTGAESATSHYLELDKNEKDLLAHVKANFDKVIVILNTGTTMELGELESDPDIDAILWMGLPGSTGAKAVGRVLTGAVNPSGHTVDTWATDFTQDPTWYNTGVYGSKFGNRYIAPDGSSSEFAFVNYEEGIYVGYRYYETRGFEENKTAETPDAWYNSHVVYPFGYGLSYTNFDWDVTFDKPDGSAIAENDAIKVTVTVTNKTQTPGKDVVQLYYSAPYTPGGIEKSHVVLGAFAKTKLIPGGGTDTVELTLKASDMKSYDWSDANGNGFKGYELEAGDYTLIVGTDAHTAKARATYNLATGVKLGEIENADGKKVEVKNRFDDLSAGIFGTDTAASYMSRRNFAGTMRTSYLADGERTLTPELFNALNDSIKRKYTTPDSGKPWEVKNESPRTSPVDNGISFADMLNDADGNYVGSVSFDDERWEKLLDELTVDEMKNLVGFGAFRTNAIKGINNVVNKPLTNDSDGPSGFTSFISGAVIYDTCSYQAECLMGATWNVELAHRMGEMVGEEGLVGNEKGDGLPYSGWYAPAVNIHRSPFAGRNWEYYSEDGLLSGKFAAAVVQGARTKGVYCYVKHFAVNDQETDREYNGILVWANEQSMRELYLEPFEITVKEGKATAMMSSFNRLGMTWAGGSYALLTEVLRDEWGFRGMVITDYSLNRYTYVDLMIRAGGDLFLTQDEKTFYMPDDATQVTLLRKATKNILYTVANSNIMSVSVDGYAMETWRIVLIVIDVVIVAALAVWGALIIYFTYKKEKTAPAEGDLASNETSDDEE